VSYLLKLFNTLSFSLKYSLGYYRKLNIFIFSYILKHNYFNETTEDKQADY